MTGPISLTDDSQAAALFAKLADIDRRAVLERIGAYVREEAHLAFVDSKSPYGAPWAALKMRVGQPLLDTGRLRNSLTYAVQGDTVEVGTNVKYAAVHQFGAVIRAKNVPYLVFKTPTGYAKVKQVTIPARPYLPTEAGGLPADWETGILDVLQGYVTEKLQ